MKKTDKKFTIITICKDNLNGLKNTYNSLVGQCFSNFDWVVIDGQSKDGSLDFLKNINFPGFVYVSEPDSGIYDAMNKGVDLSSGEYLIFMNSGDSFYNFDVLLKLSNLIQKSSSPDFIYGDSLEFDKNKNKYYKKSLPHKMLWYGMFTHHQSMVYKRKFIGETRYDISYKIASDYAFTCRLLARKKNPKIVYFPEPICIFERGGITSNPHNHWIGMREQSKVCRDILNLNFFQRIIILVLHMGKHFVMKYFSSLHSVIRYGKQ